MYAFMEVSSKLFEDSCTVLVKNTTSHITTLPTKIIGYLELRITTVKRTPNRILDINTLVRLVVHAYHPDKTGPINIHYQDEQKNQQFFWSESHWSSKRSYDQQYYL